MPLLTTFLETLPDFPHLQEFSFITGRYSFITVNDFAEALAKNYSLTSIRYDSSFGSTTPAFAMVSILRTNARRTPHYTLCFTMCPDFSLAQSHQATSRARRD